MCVTFERTCIFLEKNISDVINPISSIPEMYFDRYVPLETMDYSLLFFFLSFCDKTKASSLKHCLP